MEKTNVIKPNLLDKQYTDLLQDILDNGVTKETRNGGTLSIFGRQIRHKMSEGFPLLTTKKMSFRLIATELLWFLRGDTNIKFLVDNNCHIWDGDAYRNYEILMMGNPPERILGKDEFIQKIKEDVKIEHSPFTFAKKWGELGPVYGKQWRKWGTGENVTIGHNGIHTLVGEKVIDQITNLINDLKTNPDSRRLMVNAWNVGEIDQMVLPPCHYGFQVYTRELSMEERSQYKRGNKETYPVSKWRDDMGISKEEYFNEIGIPTRAISLMWNQRSVDTFLGLPFNIASYGLLLEIIAKLVNMVPDELIGNLGDTHLYLNHVEQAKEQIGRELSESERYRIFEDRGYEFRMVKDWSKEDQYDKAGIPKRTREPYPLPTLNINTEWWPTESGEGGIGPISTDGFLHGLDNNIQHFIRCLIDDDLQLENYQSHPAIKAPLSN